MRNGRTESDKGICLIGLVGFAEGRCGARCVEEECSAWRLHPADAENGSRMSGRCALIGADSFPRPGPSPGN